MIDNVVLKEELAMKEMQKQVITPSLVTDPADITAEEAKKVMGLEVGKHYLYGQGKEAKEVELLAIGMGGVYTFKDVHSGVKLQIAGADNALNTISLLSTSTDTKLSADTKTKLAIDAKPGSRSLFTKDEMPKEQLKALGVKITDLSATDKKYLLSGKETKDLPIIHLKTGKKTEGKLSLVRNQQTGAVSVAVQYTQRQARKKGLKI
jgi:hypothetical protein